MTAREQQQAKREKKKRELEQQRIFENRAGITAQKKVAAERAEFYNAWKSHNDEFLKYGDIYNKTFYNADGTAKKGYIDTNSILEGGKAANLQTFKVTAAWNKLDDIYKKYESVLSPEERKSFADYADKTRQAIGQMQPSYESSYNYYDNFANPVKFSKIAEGFTVPENLDVFNGMVSPSNSTYNPQDAYDWYTNQNRAANTREGLQAELNQLKRDREWARSQPVPESHTKQGDEYINYAVEGFDEAIRVLETKINNINKEYFPEDYRTWLDTSAFDGNFFSDLAAIGATLYDAGQSAVGGILDIGEGIVDTALYGFEALAMLFAGPEARRAVENLIKKDLYSGKELLQGTFGDVSKYSLLGKKSEDLLGSLGQVAATFGFQGVGVPWWLTTGTTAFGSEVESAFNQGANYFGAGVSGITSAGAEILSEQLFGGIKFGKGTLDDITITPLLNKISTKTLSALEKYNINPQTLAKWGVDAVGEGFEEIFSSVMSRLGSSLYKEEKLADLLWSEEALDEYIESFVGGFAMGGGSSAVRGAANTLSNISDTKAMGNLVLGMDGTDALIDKSKNVPELAQYVDKASKKASPYNVGKLYTEAVKTNPSLDLSNKVVAPERADRINEAFTKEIDSTNLPEEAKAHIAMEFRLPDNIDANSYEAETYARDFARDAALAYEAGQKMQQEGRNLPDGWLEENTSAAKSEQLDYFVKLGRESVLAEAVEGKKTTVNTPTPVAETKAYRPDTPQRIAARDKFLARTPEEVKKATKEDTTLNEKQREAAAYGEKLGIAVGFDDLSQYYATQRNGVSLKKKGVVVIDKNATNPMEQVLIHEFSHVAETGKSYKKLKKTIMGSKLLDKWLTEQGYKGDGLDGRIESYKKAKIDHYEKNGETLDDNGAEAEMIANFLGETIGTEAKMDKFLAELTSEQKRTFIEWLKDIWNKYFGKNKVPKELRHIERLFGKALAEAGENAKTKLTAKQEIALHKNGIGVDAENGVAWSIAYSPATIADVKQREAKIEEMAQFIHNVTGRSIEDCRKWVKAETSISAEIMQDPDMMAVATYEADERYQAIKQNSDYPQGTVDLSNLCPKRSVFTWMISRLQEKYPDRLFDAVQLAEMRGILEKADIQVACALCFVEDRRQKVGEIAEIYKNMWKDAVGSGRPLTKTNANGERKPMKITKRVAEIYGVESGKYLYATDTYIPNQYDLTTYEGFKKLQVVHPQVAMGFEMYNNSRGQQAARLIEGRAEYKRQILDWSDKKVKQVNDAGGLRIFSFSDFEVAHLVDIIQIIIDCSAKGVKIQGYTKIPAFAKLVRNTGIKLNRSLIPKGKGIKIVNGKKVLDYDLVEGMNMNDEDFLDEEESADVGNVLVGINAEQIALAMVDPFIDYIIPFHTNKSKAVCQALGLASWKNYKDSQHDKNNRTGKAAKKNINIYTEVLDVYHPKNKVEFVEAFLEVAKKKNYTPRFAEFLNTDANGNYVYTEGYHKFLVDFKLFDKQGNTLPQGLVTPNLDANFMRELIASEVEKNKDFSQYEDVFAELDSEYGEQFSISDEQVKSADPVTYDDNDIRYDIPEKSSDGQRLTDEQRRYFRNSKVRDEKGRLLAVYHGTKRAGFTTFTKTDDIGYFFARSMSTSRTYANKSKAIYAPDRYNSEAPSSDANYKVFLNITNPYVVDGKGAQWNDVTNAGDKVLMDFKIKDWDSNTYTGKGWAKLKYKGKVYRQYFTNPDQLDRFINQHLNEKVANSIAYALNCKVEEDGKGNAQLTGTLPWDFLRSQEAKTKSTRDIVREASTGRYDGVVFKNVVDSGDGSKIKADDLYVAFYPNQIKSVNNLDPTYDNDITYDIPEETQKGIDDWTVRIEADLRNGKAAVNGYRVWKYAWSTDDNYTYTIRTPEGEKIRGIIPKRLNIFYPTVARVIANDMFGISNDTETTAETYQNQEAKETREAIKEAVKKQRDKDAEKLDKIKKKYQEARKVSAEKRQKTELRVHISKKFNELNTWLLKPTKEKHVSDSLRVPVAKVLEIVNLGKVERYEKAIERLENKMATEADYDALYYYWSKQSPKKEKLESLKHALQDMRDAYAKIGIQEGEKPYFFDKNVADAIEDLLTGENGIGNTPLHELNKAQLQQLDKAISMLHKTVTEANKLFNENIKRTRAEVGEVIETQLRETNRPLPIKLMQRAFSYMLKPDIFFKNIGSKMLNLLWKNIKRAESQKALLVQKAKNKAEEIAKKYNAKKWDMKSRKEFVSANNVRFTLSLGEMMTLYAYSKRDQAKQHITVGGFEYSEQALKNYRKEYSKGAPSKAIEALFKTNEVKVLSEEMLEEISTMLTEEQRNFVDDLVAYLSNDMAKLGNEVTMKRYDIKGFTEGYYFPIVSSQNFLYYSPDKTADPNILNMGFTKELNPNATNALVLYDFMELWGKHVDNMTTYATFALPMEDLTKAFNYGDVKKMLEEWDGKGKAVEYIKQLMRDINHATRGDPSARWVGKRLADFKFAQTGLSLSTIIQQPSSLPRAFAKIEPKYFVKPSKKIDKTELEKISQRMLTHSGLAILKEMGSYDTDIGKSTADYISGKSTILESTKEAIGKAPALMDKWTWLWIWKAAENKVTAETSLAYNTDQYWERVREVFEECVSETQVYDSTLSRSQLMRSKDTGAKMVTAFMSEPTTIVNMVYDALVDISEGNVRRGAKTMAYVTMACMLNAILVSLVYAERDENEELSYPEKFIEALIGETMETFNPLTYFPIIRDVWSVTLGYSVDRTDMSVFAKLYDSAERLVKSDGSAEGWIEFTARLGNFFLPTYNAYREVKAAVNMFNQPDWNITEFGVEAAVRNALRKGTPGLKWIDNPTTKKDALYDSLIAGDTVYHNRLKKTYESEDAYRKALVSGLKENDPRIVEAAIADIEMDVGSRVEIAKEIQREGYFTQKEVVDAIFAESTALKKKVAQANRAKEDGDTEEYNKLVNRLKIDYADKDIDSLLLIVPAAEVEDSPVSNSYYRTSDLNKALELGDPKTIKDTKSVLVQDYIDKGYTKQEALTSLKTSVTTHWKPLYIEAYEADNTAEMTRIKKMLEASGLYTNVSVTLREWYVDYRNEQRKRK